MPDRGPREATSRRAIPRPRRSPEQPDEAGNHQPPAAPSAAPPATAPIPPSRLVRHLTDPSIQAAIDAFVATAPPLTEDQRARLARLLRTDHCHRHDQAA